MAQRHEPYAAQKARGFLDLSPNPTYALTPAGAGQHRSSRSGAGRCVVRLYPALPGSTPPSSSHLLKFATPTSHIPPVKTTGTARHMHCQSLVALGPLGGFNLKRGEYQTRCRQPAFLLGWNIPFRASQVLGLRGFEYGVWGFLIHTRFWVQGLGIMGPEYDHQYPMWSIVVVHFSSAGSSVSLCIDVVAFWLQLLGLKVPRLGGFEF